MSGGIAYIFDPSKEFPSKCNKASVDLLALECEEDITFMKSILEEFKAETGSEVADRILNNFDAMKECFVKVFPHEYQRALAELELEKQQAQSKSSTAIENGEAQVSNDNSESSGDDKKEGKCKDEVG